MNDAKHDKTLISSGDFHRMKIASESTDRAELARLAGQEGDARVRQAASRRLEELRVRQEVFGRQPDATLDARQGCFDDEDAAYREAIARLTDKALLVSVAQTSSMLRVRQAALWRLVDPERLAGMPAGREGLPPPWPEVLALLPLGVGDSMWLWRSAMASRYLEAARAAVKRLRNRVLLAELAERDPS